MVKTRGGARPGAGRKPADRTPDGQLFDSAEDYLQAVVEGRVTADALRISAAKTLIRYQTAKRRLPVKALTPGEAVKKEKFEAETALNAEFEAKAKEIRERHSRRKEK
jgi:hypothetical protein